MNRNTLTALVVLTVLFLGLGYWLRHGPPQNNPQCVNYGEPQKTACEQEREAFNIDLVVDKIVQSLRLT